MVLNLLEMSKRVHELNKKWWIDLETGERIDRNVGQLCMLVISELAEACEGYRKNLPDDKLPHRKMVEVELADALIRLLDLAGGYNLPLSADFLIDDTGYIIEEFKCGTKDFLELEILCVISITAIYSHWRIDVNTDTYSRYASMNVTQAIVDIISLAGLFNLDIMGAYEEKLIYNTTRIDHTIEHRKSEHGKKC